VGTVVAMRTAFPDAAMHAAQAARQALPASGAHGSRQRPSIGRIVHYVMSQIDGRLPGDHRPAIIVRVWSDDCVNLQVFTDLGDGCINPTFCVSSASRDDNGKDHGSWHFPEYVG
jgi:hypothetical protein